MRTLGGNTHFLYGCFFALLTACLCGCITISGPPGKEAIAIQQNHQTIVLARVVYVDDVHGQQGPSWLFSFDSWQLSDAHGQMKNPPVQENISLRALSKASRDQGWFYLVMNPGSYCLSMTLDPDSTDDNVDQPVFYLSVPVDQPLVYAGTLVFNRQTEKRGKKEVTSCVMDRVADESATARSVIGGQFSGFGEMTPDLLMAYDSAGINSNQLVNVQSNPATSTGPNPVLKGNNWRGADVIEAPAMVTFEDNKDTGNAGTFGLAWILLTAPVALATEGITAHVHHKQWAPVEAAFRKQVAAFHLDDKLQQALASRLNLVATNSTASTALRLEAQPYSIVLRGDKHQKFNLEVAARVLLCNSTNETPIWEHDYLCTYDSPDSATAGTYQTFIPSWYGQHQLEEYHGDAGTELMRHELESAVGAITDEVIGDLYAGPDASSVPAIKNVAVTGETPPQSRH